MGIRVDPQAPVPVDEKGLFQGSDGGRLREELRGHFGNISAVMDCVGCEKCKLWGKLQMLGLGTALKVLFPPHPLGSAARLVLSRNEVIALVNLLHRLSESLLTSRAMGEAIAAGTADLRPPERDESFLF